MKKVAIFIFKLILGLILMLSILGETVIILMSNTILNKSYMISKLEEQNYYANLYTNVINEMENYIGPSGFDEQIFDGVVSKAKLEKDVQIVMANIYDGRTEEISSEEVEKKLEKNINKFLKKRNMQVEDDTSLKDFKAKIGEVYRNNVAYNTYTKYLNILSSSKLRKLISLGKEVCFAGIIALLVLFVIINIKSRKKIITEWMTSLIASGIILLVACIYFEAKVKIDSITLLNGAVTLLVRDVIHGIVNMTKYTGIIYIVSGSVIMLINNFVTADKEKKHHHHHHHHHEHNEEEDDQAESTED